MLGAGVNTDSLLNVIDGQNGADRIRTRLDLSFSVRKLDHSVALEQGKLALLESQKINSVSLKAESYYCAGLAFYYMTQPDSAFDNFKEAIDIYKNLKNDEKLCQLYSFAGFCHLSISGNQKEAIDYFNKGIYYAKQGPHYISMGMIYSHISNIYRMNGSYKKSMEAIFESKSNYQKAGYAEGVAWISYSIGRLYDTMHLYEEARESFLTALDEYRKLNNELAVMRGEAICYDELALVYIELGDLQKARNYNALALESYERVRSKFGLSNAYKYLARIEYQEKNYDEAMKYLDISLAIKKGRSDALGYPGVYTLYGKILIAHKEYERAVDSLKIGLKYADANEQKNNIIKLNKQITRAYEALGDYKNAYKYQSEELALADSIYHSKVTRNMTQLEALYQNEVNEKMIKELEQGNLINELSLEREKTVRYFLISILGLFICVVLLLFLMNRRVRLANQALQQSEIQLREINASKDKFFSIISHDLKSPFNTLIGFSGLMRSYCKDKDYDKIDEFSKYIYDTSHKTFELLENLLDWSRSQTGNIKYNPETVNINEFVQDLIKPAVAMAQQKEITISYEGLDSDIEMDKNMMHTALENILENAVKYSYKGGTISVIVREIDRRIQISIQDAGMGMDKDEADRLFQLGETFHKEGTEGETGTGLGLILAKEFVDRHSGTIQVESQKSVGTKFIVSIPQNK